MKMIGTVVLVLIAGMSRSTSARVHIDHTRSLHTKNPGGAAESLLNCYGPVSDQIKETSNNLTRVDVAISTYCNTTAILDNCLRGFGENLKLSAAGSDRFVFVDPLINVLTSMILFPCAHSQLIKDLLNTTDQQCITSKQDAVAACLRIITMDHSTTIPEINPQELETGFYNNRTCSNILAAEQCGVRVLEECEDKRFSTTFDSLLKYANNDIPCGNLPRSPRTQVSPAQYQLDSKSPLENIEKQVLLGCSPM